MEFFSEGETKYEPRQIMFLGQPGAGKTRLAGTFGHPFFIDVDRGAATALRGKISPNRVVLDFSPNTRKQVRQLFTDLAKQKPQKDGTITYQVGDGPEIKIGTVVLDTLSALQEACEVHEVRRGRVAKMDYDQYAMMLALIQEVVIEWKNCPVHLIVNCHSKKREVDNRSWDEMSPNLVGSIRDRLPKWFDIILHIMIGKDGSRYAITDGVILNGIKYMAKDRHDELAGLLEEGQRFVKLENLGGYPDDRIAKLVTRQEEA